MTYLFLPTILFLIVSFCSSWIFAEGKIEKISIIDLRPTQPYAGLAAAETTRRVKLGKIEDEKSLQEKIISMGAFRAVKGPGGRVFLTDGHHRAIAIYQMSQTICGKIGKISERQRCPRDSQVPVTIEKDLSASSWEDFNRYMISTKNTYIPESLRTKIKNKEITGS